MCIALLGMCMVTVGECFRKGALLTAGFGFTHAIEMEKRDEHKLATTGVYAFCRHPGYLGWYLWAVGTQVMLCNPVSIVLFYYVSYKFFADRIPFEERLLIKFFGDQYLDYKKKVP